MAYLSVVIPVYKAEDCLQELYDRLVKNLSSISSDFEIVLIEDHGPDSSWYAIQTLSAKDPRVRGFRMSRNFGQHRAITAGLDVCDGDWVYVMDCDLQDRPEDIPKLYEHAQQGHPVVRASRDIRSSDSYLKRAFSYVFYFVFRVMSGLPYDGRSANFRIMKRSVVEHFRLYRESLRFFGALMHIAGHDGVAVSVSHGARYAGNSSYSYRKLMQLGVETILAYSNRPLYMIIMFGFAVSFLSFVITLFIIYQAITQGFAVVGWASLACGICFLSGIILVCLGVIGLYLAHVFDEVKRRPLYVLSEKTQNA